MQHREITKTIIGGAMKVHRALGPGFLESVYQNALAYELGKEELRIDLERPIAVRYENVIVGDFLADMVVDEQVLIEVKAVRSLSVAHEVQLVNYLTATGIDVGLLLNFGGPSLEFKRKVRVYNPPPRLP